MLAVSLSSINIYGKTPVYVSLLETFNHDLMIHLFKAHLFKAIDITQSQKYTILFENITNI